MAVKFQLRRDTAANWTAANTVLDLGEPGVETDTLKLKIGDGVTPWNSLDYSVIREFSELLNPPTTLAGYGITDAATSAQGALADTALQPGDGLSGAFTGDVTGSVFADDSTVMVDGVSATVNLANNSITDLSDADQTVQTTDDVTFNSVTGNVFTSLIDSSDSSAITITPDVVMSAGLTVGNHILPSSNVNIDLGSATNRFRDLYLSGNTIDLGGALISKGTGNTIELPVGTNIGGVNVAATDQDLNTTDSVNFHNITTTGHLAGPATFTIDPAAVGDNTGVVVIAGDLQVDGTTTTINSTTLEVEDKNVVLGPNVVNDAANNGAGITVTQPDTSDASLIYNTTDTQWEFNKDVNLGSNDLQAARILADSATTPQTIYYVSSVEKGYSRINSEVLEHNGTAGVMLRHNGFEKLSTTTTGVDVTGAVTADGLTVASTATIDLTSDANPAAKFSRGSNNTTNVNYYYNTTLTGQLGAADQDFQISAAGASTPLSIYVNGSMRQQISTTGQTLLTTGDTNEILLVKATSSSASRILLSNTGTASDNDVNIWSQNQDFVVNTGTNDEALRVKDTGNVGIGTSGGTVDHKLHVKGDTGATPLVHFDNSGGDAGDGPALKVSASGRGTGIRDASIFSIHNLNGEIFSVRNDGHTTAPNFIAEAINVDKSDNATDVFVYDTTKDSDYGAWRNRTQNTSWYNEELNTTKRGRRREFPAVAVIVAETDAVTIYDGDDPELPMWMVFDVNNSYWLKHTSVSKVSVTMQNGVLVTGGSSSTGRLSVVDFVKDSAYVSEPGYNYEHEYIATRNSSAVGPATGDIFIAGINVQAVAMTVLPNAPIDSVSGLPVPTIAAATTGGVSVIKDSGVVVDITAGAGSSYDSVQWIDITENNYLIFEQDSSERAVFWIPIPDADRTTQTNDGSIEDKVIMKYYENGAHLPYPTYNGAGIQDGIGLAGDNQALKGSSGDLTIFEPNTVSPEYGKVAYVTSDYNTGWMVGDIKLATLSDTDDTNITSTNILTGDNSTFTSTQGSWVASQATTSIQSGTLQIVPDSGVNGGAYYALTTTAGTQYIASVEITQDASSFSRLSAATSIDISSYNNISNLGSKMNMGVGTHSISFTATGTTTYLWLVVGGGTQQATRFDNVLVSLAEEDRSNNGNGLQVFGTVTKSPVATSADLVAYSGFSTSNYLAQPYNSDIDVGTGDFSISIWAKADSFDSYNAIFAHWRLNQTDAAQFTLETVGSKIRFYIVDNGAFAYAGGDTTLSTGVWYQFTITRTGGVITLYINGVAESTTLNYSGDLTARTDPLSIGVLWNTTGLAGGAQGPWNGSLALARFSATAPTAEQIKKIYEDELRLFQPDARATLYGTSDAVTALAYDEDTEYLHVGTSSGRSVFDGLRRIDNTTDAVTATISAVNNFVAED